MRIPAVRRPRIVAIQDRRAALREELEHQGQVISRRGTQLHAGRRSDGEPADGAERAVLHGYRPLKSGARFSRKAAIPSFWSSLAKRR